MTELDYPDADVEEERERLADADDDELRDELERVDEEICEWRDEYGVETPDALVESTDEEMEVNEREKRREVAYDWRHNLYTRELILDVLGEDS